LKTSDFVPQGSASHTAVVWQDSMYIVGGESFKKGHMLYVYDFNGKFLNYLSTLNNKIEYLFFTLFYVRSCMGNTSCNKQNSTNHKIWTFVCAVWCMYIYYSKNIIVSFGTEWPSGLRCWF